MKRGPSEFKQDLEDIVDEENIEQLLAWVQSDFKDQIKAFQTPKTTVETKSQNLEVKKAKAEEAKPSQKVEKKIIQEVEHSNTTFTEKSIENKTQSLENHAPQKSQRESIKAEPLESGQRVHSDYF